MSHPCTPCVLTPRLTNCVFLNLFSFSIHTTVMILLWRESFSLIVQFIHMLIVNKISGPRGKGSKKMNEFWSLQAPSLLWERKFGSHCLPNPLARKEQNIVLSLLTLATSWGWCLEIGTISRNLKCFLCTLCHPNNTPIFPIWIFPLVSAKGPYFLKFLPASVSSAHVTTSQKFCFSSVYSKAKFTDFLRICNVLKSTCHLSSDSVFWKSVFFMGEKKRAVELQTLIPIRVNKSGWKSPGGEWHGIVTWVQSNGWANSSKLICKVGQL